MTTAERPVLVIGGTGKTGRRVAARLERMGQPVRIGSRRGEPPFAWEDRVTWQAALRGCRAAYLAYAPDVALPEAAEAIGVLGSLAARSGVERLVLLSGRGEEGALRAEEAVRAAGPAWTVLRCAWFVQNFTEGLFAEDVRHGEVALPADGIREPFLDAGDVADVAVAALTAEGHAGQTYELTGPRLLTFAQAVAEVGRAAGRAVRYTPVPLATYEARLRALGVPEPEVALTRYLFAEVLDGRNASLADGVWRALRRPPRGLAEAAREAAGPEAGGAGPRAARALPAPASPVRTTSA